MMMGSIATISAGGPARKGLGLLLAAATIALFVLNLRLRWAARRAFGREAF